MPRPVRSDQKYLPGLDGLRALAVTAVIAYHLGYGWAQGGLLGVGVFFTLSGYLITDILVGQFAASGRVKLGDFWLRRARRLLPALFVMLAVVTVWVNAFNRAFVPGYRGDVVASGLYVNNWWYIFQHDSYYSRFAPPAPLDHLWSLAVEEQFYLVWPWVVLAMVLIAGWLVKRRRVRLLGPGTHVEARGSDFLSGRARWAMAGVALVLATASAIEMAMLYHPGYDPTRIYEGTDTRAFGLLIGAAVAMVYPTRQGGRTLSAAARRVLDAAGLVGLVVVVLLVWRTNQYSPFMFQGGLEVLSVATALVVAAVATPGGLLGRALGWTPMRWIGVRSYGIYLWHYPIIVLTAAAGTVGTPVSAVRAVVLVAATVVIAALSWRFIEEPIRRGSYRRTAPAVVAGGVAGATGAVASAARPVGGGHVTVLGGTAGGGAAADGGANGAVAADGGTAGNVSAREVAGAGGRRRLSVLPSPLAIGGLCLLATAGITAGVTSANSRQTSNTADTSAAGQAGTAGGGAALAQSAAAGAATAGQSGASGATGAASMTSAGQGKQTATAKGVAAGSGGSGGSSDAQPTGGYATQPVIGGPATTLATGAATVAALPTPPPRTSCTSVVHIGDSTSDGLFSSDYLPDKAQQIPAQYAAVGVKKTVDKVVGATSVVESLPGTPNAQTMASGMLKSGYHGCWVIALGTNDTADVAVGSEVSRAQRIKMMMALIGSQPVMWVEVKSILSSGPYSESNMELWDQALQQALPSYPNMRLYNWPAVVQNSWFISDGIHFTSDGYAHRGKMIAEALAEAFPAN
jgi:peptidoglycan/LPS O-acetylase OafA/YrhL